MSHGLKRKREIKQKKETEKNLRMGYRNSFCISKIKWIAFPMKKNLSVIRS